MGVSTEEWGFGSQPTTDPNNESVNPAYRNIEPSRRRRYVTVERRAQGGYTFKLEEITKSDPPYGDSAIPPKS